jgi:hypothetical protein
MAFARKKHPRVGNVGDGPELRTGKFAQWIEEKVVDNSKENISDCLGMISIARYQYNRLTETRAKTGSRTNGCIVSPSWRRASKAMVTV